jgi:hypothetical protein
MAKVLAFDVGIKNLSYCLMEDCDILDWDLIDLTDDGSESTTSKAKKQKQDMQKLSSTLFEKLQEKFDNCQIDHVIIENQPVFKNPRMKSIQILIYSFFAYKRVIEDRQIEAVTFVAANTKVKYAESHLQKIGIEIEKCENKYKYNKKISIQCTSEIVQNHEELAEWFANHKKQDDLADAYLLGLSYLERKCRSRKK